MRTAFINTVMECAREDERIWLLCGDLGYSVLERFAQAFPERFINAGVAEQNMTGIAAGLALGGQVAISYSIGNFNTLRCLEQVRNDVCYHDANVKIVSVGGGLAYGGQGYTHHAVEDFAAMRALPNMTVLAPADPVEAQLATRWMLAHPHPCYLRLGKAGEKTIHTTPPAFEPGRIIWMKQGGDVVLVSTGAMLETALAVAALLEAKGMAAAVGSSPFVKPFDTIGVQQRAQNATLVATLEEHAPYGGLADAVAAAMAGMEGARARLLPFTIPEGVLKGIAGEQQELRLRAGLSADRIAQCIIENNSRG